MWCNFYGCCDCHFLYSVWPKCAWFVVSFAISHGSLTVITAARADIVSELGEKCVICILGKKKSFPVTCVWEEGSRQRECDEKYWYVEKTEYWSCNDYNSAEY